MKQHVAHMHKESSRSSQAVQDCSDGFQPPRNIPVSYPAAILPTHQKWYKLKWRVARMRLYSARRRFMFSNTVGDLFPYFFSSFFPFSVLFKFFKG